MQKNVGPSGIAPRATSRIVNAGLLDDGSILNFDPTSTSRWNDKVRDWIKLEPSRGIARWCNASSKQLEWSADGKRYSPSALTLKIIFEATGVEIGAIRGTNWWRFNGKTLTEIARGAEREASPRT